MTLCLQIEVIVRCTIKYFLCALRSRDACCHSTLYPVSLTEGVAKRGPISFRWIIKTSSIQKIEQFILDFLQAGGKLLLCPLYLLYLHCHCQSLSDLWWVPHYYLSGLEKSTNTVNLSFGLAPSLPTLSPSPNYRKPLGQGCGHPPLLQLKLHLLEGLGHLGKDSVFSSTQSSDFDFKVGAGFRVYPWLDILPCMGSKLGREDPRYQAQGKLFWLPLPSGIHLFVA